MGRNAIVNDLYESALISQAQATALAASDAAVKLHTGLGAAVATVATADADATYGQPEADLINECKDQLNALLAELRTLNVIAT